VRLQEFVALEPGLQLARPGSPLPAGLRLGNRVAEPYQFLSSKSEHNGDMFTGEVLKIDDQKTIGVSGSAFAPGIFRRPIHALHLRSRFGFILSFNGAPWSADLASHYSQNHRMVRWQVANMSYKPDANDASVKLNGRS
jgi:hypothetical protein